jgi:hypothetical protein
MNMKMIYGLAAVGLTVDHKPGAIFGKAQFHSQFLGLVQQPSGQVYVFGLKFHDVWDMLFGDQKKMHRRLGGDIVKSQRLIVLVYFLARDLTFYDFTKNAIIHNTAS